MNVKQLDCLLAEHERKRGRLWLRIRAVVRRFLDLNWEGEGMTEEELNEMAEKYALSKWEGQVPWGLIAQGYKDGYLEGLKAKINTTTISDCPVKDEWHRLGKNPNDLPDEDVPVLCVRGGNIYVAWYGNNEWRGTKWEQVKKPYAWKEIVLPELKEIK